MYISNLLSSALALASIITACHATPTILETLSQNYGSVSFSAEIANVNYTRKTDMATSGISPGSIYLSVNARSGLNCQDAQCSNDTPKNGVIEIADSRAGTPSYVLEEEIEESPRLLDESKLIKSDSGLHYLAHAQVDESCEHRALLVRIWMKIDSIILEDGPYYAYVKFTVENDLDSNPVGQYTLSPIYDGVVPVEFSMDRSYADQAYRSDRK